MFLSSRLIDMLMVRDLWDDVESFLWVLLWGCVNFDGPGIPDRHFRYGDERSRTFHQHRTKWMEGTLQKTNFLNPHNFVEGNYFGQPDNFSPYFRRMVPILHSMCGHAWEVALGIYTIPRDKLYMRFLATIYNAAYVFGKDVDEEARILGETRAAVERIKKENGARRNTTAQAK